jgi:NAD(P)-dependent dehydrogenase (short-subunit alcohol dehydrogenase family)
MKIVITGTTSGIGKAIVDKFKHCIPENEVIELNRDTMDLRNPAEISGWDVPDDIDVFINNAGVMFLTHFEEAVRTEWEDTINVNLRAPYLLCQKVIPKIKDGGHLINIASVSGIYPDKDLISYCVSKAGLIMMTNCLSRLYSDRIFVNCISPGFVKSNLCKGEPTPDCLINEIPMKREAEPEEIADVVYHIINSKYYNGSNIVVDGGFGMKHFGN